MRLLLVPLLFAVAFAGTWPDRSELKALVYGGTQDGITDGLDRYRAFLDKFVEWLAQKPWPYKNLDKMYNRCTRGYIDGPAAHDKIVRPRWDTFHVTIQDGGALRMVGTVDVSAYVPTWLYVAKPMPFDRCWFHDTVCNTDVFVSATIDLDVLFTAVLDPAPVMFAHMVSSGGGHIRDDYTFLGCDFHEWWRHFVDDFNDYVQRGVQYLNEVFQLRILGVPHTVVYQHMNQYLQRNLVFDHPDYDLGHGMMVHYEVEDIRSVATQYFMILPNTVLYLTSGYIYQDVMPDRAVLRPPTVVPPSSPDNRLTNFVLASVSELAALWDISQKQGVSNLNETYRVLDANITTNIQYGETVFAVPPEGGVVHVHIAEVLVTATCRDVENVDMVVPSPPKALFVVRFFDVDAVATANYTPQTYTLTLQLRAFNFSTTNITLLVPNVLIPRPFMTDVAERMLRGSLDVINLFLAERGLVLPENIRPLVPNPRMTLVHQEGCVYRGCGYVMIESYCSCASTPDGPAWARCRNHVCGDAIPDMSRKHAAPREANTHPTQRAGDTHLFAYYSDRRLACSLDSVASFLHLFPLDASSTCVPFPSEISEVLFGNDSAPLWYRFVAGQQLALFCPDASCDAGSCLLAIQDAVTMAAAVGQCSPLRNASGSIVLDAAPCFQPLASFVDPAAPPNYYYQNDSSLTNLGPNPLTTCSPVGTPLGTRYLTLLSTASDSYKVSLCTQASDCALGSSGCSIYAVNQSAFGPYLTQGLPPTPCDSSPDGGLPSRILVAIVIAGIFFVLLVITTVIWCIRGDVPRRCSKRCCPRWPRNPHDDCIWCPAEHCTPAPPSCHMDMVQVLLILVWVLAVYHAILFTYDSTNPLSIFSWDMLARLGIPTESFTFDRPIDAAELWRRIGRTMLWTTAALFTVPLFLRGFYRNKCYPRSPSACTLGVVLILTVALFAFCFVTPLFLHFNDVHVNTHTYPWFLNHPESAKSLDRIMSMGFGTVALGYLCNTFVFFLHALPAGAVAGSVLFYALHPLERGALDLLVWIVVHGIPPGMLPPILVLYQVFDASALWFAALVMTIMAFFLSGVLLREYTVEGVLNQERDRRYEPVETCAYWRSTLFALVSGALYVSATVLMFAQETRFEFVRLHYVIVLWLFTMALSTAVVYLLYNLARQGYDDGFMDVQLPPHEAPAMTTTCLGKIWELVCAAFAWPFDRLSRLVLRARRYDFVYRAVMWILSPALRLDRTLKVYMAHDEPCLQRIAVACVRTTVSLVWLWPVSFVALLLHVMAHGDECKTAAERLPNRARFLCVGTVLSAVLLAHAWRHLQESPLELLMDACHRAGYDLVTPDGPTFLDDCFHVYDVYRHAAFACKFVAFFLFCEAVYCECYSTHNIDASWHTIKPRATFHRQFSFWSRSCVYAGVILVLIGSILPGAPNYLDAAHIDSIIAPCAPKFNRLVRSMLAYIVSAFGVAIFMAQLTGLLLSVTPSIQRVAFLMNRDGSNRHLAELRAIIMATALSTPLVNCVSSIVLAQLLGGDDPVISWLLLALWVLPALLVALAYTCKSSIGTMYLGFLLSFCGVIIALAARIIFSHGYAHALATLLTDVMTYISVLTVVLLTNVALSDILYQFLRPADDTSGFYHACTQQCSCCYGQPSQQQQPVQQQQPTTQRESRVAINQRRDESPSPKQSPRSRAFGTGQASRPFMGEFITTELSSPKIGASSSSAAARNASAAVASAGGYQPLHVGVFTS